MKPAFSYYGGKQHMSSKLIPLIPKHTVYVEPFAGGAALFFKKPWPATKNQRRYREVLNDADGCIVNFYRMLRERPEELIRACCLTPYSRKEHREATEGLEEGVDCDIERARMWFVGVQMSFACMIGGGWRTGVITQNQASSWSRACANLYECADRMHSVHLECDDATEVIKRWDSPQTFFYCDPPYPGADQGHYGGYSQEDFSKLISALDSCDGSFLLSNYDQPGIPDRWERFEFPTKTKASGKGSVGKGRDKTKINDKETESKKRTEVVWRVIRGENVRPEIRELYEQGDFDCFVGA